MRISDWSSDVCSSDLNNRADLDAALARKGTPAILKTRRFGYEGKGQARIMKPEDADAAWTLIAEQPTILEGFVRFDRAYTEILARPDDGEGRFWSVPDHLNRVGILSVSTFPVGQVFW